jgi:microcompartment protein CcmK/EutM
MLRFGLLALLLASLVPGSALAQQVVQQNTNVQQAPDDGPSIFSMGYSGLLAGAGIGAAGGYLVGRRDGWKKSDWRAVGLGIGIGALAGAGFGIMLGVVDKSGAPGGRYVARDLAAGAGFGALVGLIAGGISAARNDKAEYALFGTAIGVCAGAGLGIITGIIEGAAKRRRSNAATTTTVSRLHLEPSLDFVPLKENSLGTAVSGIRGSF